MFIFFLEATLVPMFWSNSSHNPLKELNEHVIIAMTTLFDRFCYKILYRHVIKLAMNIIIVARWPRKTDE